MKTYRIKCLSETVSPLTHMDRTVGNEAIVARECIIADGARAWVPYISGNAIRHRMLREPGMLWLINKYDLKGKLTPNMLNFLLHGGNLVSSDGRENTQRIVEMKRTWALLRLLGVSLPDQIIAGSLDVWRGRLVCRENTAHIEQTSERHLRPACDFVSNYRYTRGDSSVKHQDLTNDDPLGKSNLMLFAGQAVQVGALWQHGFVLKHVSGLELGALLWSLRLWQSSGSTIGGQAAKGHGRLKLHLLDFSENQKLLCEQYVDYALSVRSDAIAWLFDTWNRYAKK